MQDEKSYVRESCEAALSVYLRMQNLAALLPHSPGCIVWKGPGKRYAYWQVREKKRQVQRYIKADQLESVKAKIEKMKEMLSRLQELKRYFKRLKGALRAFGVSWETVFANYRQKRKNKRDEEAQRETALAIAGEKAYSENYKHMTDQGDLVASKSEVLIANSLFAFGVQYQYEKPFTLADGRVVKPDFTIYRPDGSTVIWEHAGLSNDRSYMEKHEYKVREYEKCGYTRSRNLIVTFDKNGTLSAADVRRVIDLYELT